ncbi:hypothetical protein GCM10027289_21180 [Tsukamurella serpentis]
MFSDFHPSSLGGIQNSVNDQRRELERRGHLVTLFTPPAGDSELARSGAGDQVVTLRPVLGVRVNGFPATLPTRTNARLIDAALARLPRVDVVHVHTTYGVAAIGMRTANLLGVPLVQTMHSRDDVFIEANSAVPGVSARALRLLHSAFVPHRAIAEVPESPAARDAWRVMINQARAADSVIAPTAHFAAALREHGLANQVTVISGGVDADDLPLGGLSPERPVYSGGELRVLWCGRLSPEKRPLEAIEAVLATPGVTLDLLGDGPLEEAARLLALRDRRIRVHGRLDRPAVLTAMREHDLVIFNSSGYETQGLVALEAAAVGTPVLYCDPNLEESLPGDAGLRSRDASVEALSEMLRRVHDDPQLLAAARSALRGTDLRQAPRTDEIERLYRTVITDHRRTATPLPATAAEVPQAEGALPLLGHSAVALTRGLHFIRDLRTAGPVVRLTLGPKRAYVLTTPELVREVGFRTAGQFHRRDVQESMREAVQGATNVLCGQEHDLRRRMIAPALRSGRIAEYAGAAAAIVDRWSTSLPFERRIDLRTQAHGLILQIVTSTLFTADLGAAASERIRQDMPWLLSQVIIRGALPTSVQRMRVRANRRFTDSAAALRREIGAVVAAYRVGGQDRHDVLSALVGHIDPETGARLSDDEIVDELILMIAAGVGSTASILAWVWHEIMSDETVAAQVRTEITEVVGTGPVTPDHLPRLAYLRRVVQETLRMWGPWISSQNADGEVVFGRGDAATADGTTLTLPPDSMIVFSPYLIHHDPRHFPDPERFDPDRWREDRAHEIDKRAVLPFGVGERHCPGSSFAMTIILLATASLYAQREPRPVGGAPRPSTTDFVPAPSRLPVLLGPRRYD